MITISITAEKGGEGKTTTASALHSGLQKRGYKVLAVDVDPQCNLSFITGATKGTQTVLEALTGETSANNVIQHTDNGNIIPSSGRLSSIDQILANHKQKPYKLKNALDPISDKYDYCIIDTPPALGTLTANALTASDYIVIPTQPDVCSEQGIATLWATVQEARKYTNPDLKIAGILLTRFLNRPSFNKAIREELEREFTPVLETKLFKTEIREAIAIRESKFFKQSIFDYAPKSKVAEDYNNFIDELLRTINE